MKKIIKLFFIFHSSFFICAGATPAAYAAPAPAADSFAIVDSDDDNISADPVTLNADAGLADVRVFDIAGIMLGMPFEDVYTMFFKTKGQLYSPRKEDSIIYTMHKDWKYNLDYECRQQNIYVPDALKKCINTLGRARGLLYASELHLLRENTGETITVYFTSNATDNRVWRVIYKNDVNEIEGDKEKFENQREKKILVFWQYVLDKFGPPNSGNDKWISSSNAYDPMMTAYYGVLDLVDMGLNASDMAMNVTASRENFRAKPYSF